MNFEANCQVHPLFDSSGWLRLLSISKSSRNLSIVSSSRCFRFSKRIIAWCPEPLIQNGMTRFRRISQLCPAGNAFWPSQFRAVPSKLLVSALHSCLSDRSSSSKCTFIISIQVSMQPSDSSL